MANIFRETQYVLDDVMVRFWNYLSFVRTANRNFENKFKDLTFATGSTINARLEERYLAGEGATATSESRVQVIRPLTIEKQFRIMLEYTGFELTFNRARDLPYLEMANAPRAKALANTVEKYVAEGFYKDSYHATGTPGVAVDLDTILTTQARMDELGIPDDGKRYCGVRPTVQKDLSNDLFNTFNTTVNTGALIDGFIGNLANFDFFKTVFLPRHIAGAGQAGGAPPAGFKLGGVVTNGPISSGNTIEVGSLGQAAGTTVFHKGDIIEVADASGVFVVNPLTYASIGQRAQFVVTADVVSASGATAVIPVSPEIIISGARQNFSAAIPNGAQMLLRDDHNVSLAYHSQALYFAAPPLKELRGGVEAVTRYHDLYKLAMTATLGADIRNYQQLDRADIICGKLINPEFVVRVCS